MEPLSDFQSFMQVVIPRKVPLVPKRHNQLIRPWSLAQCLVVLIIALVVMVVMSSLTWLTATVLTAAVSLILLLLWWLRAMSALLECVFRLRAEESTSQRADDAVTHLA